MYVTAFAAALTCGSVALAIVPGRAQPVGYIFAPLCALLTWRLWMLGAHVEPAGVKVVGYLFSKRTPWEEIDRFEVQPFQNYPYAGHIILRNGDERLIPGLEVGRPKTERGRQKVQQKVDELNRELADWHCGKLGNAEGDRSTKGETN